MIPSEYKLDYVVARLIERLEGTRRSFGQDQQQAAEEAFARIAAEHVNAAMGEFREVAMADQPDLHVDFVQREVLDTFLPRYARLALEANGREASGYGLGVMGTLVGRILLGFMAVIVLVMLPRLRLQGLFYPSIPVLLAMPFLPDCFRWFHQRRHRRDLEDIVSDMSVIQDRNDDYEPVSRLRTEEVSEPASATGHEGQKESQ